MKGRKKNPTRKQGLSLKLKNYFQAKTVAKTLFPRFKLLPYTHSSLKMIHICWVNLPADQLPGKRQKLQV